MEIQRKMFGEHETPTDIRIAALRKKHAEDAVRFPIIVHAGGWDVPQDLRKHIAAARVCQLAEDPERFIKYAVDAEAVAYLMTASLCFPFSHEWAQIYLHVAGKYMTEKGLKQLPDFIDDVKLNDYERNHLLKPLKRWIRQKQFKHMKGLKRESRGQSIKRNDQTVTEAPVLCDSSYAA